MTETSDINNVTDIVYRDMDMSYQIDKNHRYTILYLNSYRVHERYCSEVSDDSSGPCTKKGASTDSSSMASCSAVVRNERRTLTAT